MKRLLRMMLMLTMLTALCAQTAFAVNDVEETGAALETVSLAEVDEVLQAGVARVMPMDYEYTSGSITVNSDDSNVPGYVKLKLDIWGEYDAQGDNIMSMEVSGTKKSSQNLVSWDITGWRFSYDGSWVTCKVDVEAEFKYTNPKNNITYETYVNTTEKVYFALSQAM